jgi:hypothetical protein
MKLRVYIARQYKNTDILAIKAANPSYDEIAATKHFVESKYGDWIDNNMKEAANDYLLIVDDTEHFDVDFTYRNHAEEFRIRVGGNYL